MLADNEASELSLPAAIGIDPFGWLTRMTAVFPSEFGADGGPDPFSESIVANGRAAPLTDDVWQRLLEIAYSLAVIQVGSFAFGFLTCGPRHRLCGSAFGAIDAAL